MRGKYCEYHKGKAKQKKQANIKRYKQLKIKIGNRILKDNLSQNNNFITSWSYKKHNKKKKTTKIALRSTSWSNCRNPFEDWFIIVEDVQHQTNSMRFTLNLSTLTVFRVYATFIHSMASPPHRTIANHRNIFTMTNRVDVLTILLRCYKTNNCPSNYLIQDSYLK